MAKNPLQGTTTQSLLTKWNEQMKLIESKTGIRGGIVLSFLLICLILVYFNIFDTIITNLIGTLYPVFWTMKSIETRGDDYKHWLTYWVCFGCFSIVDMFSGFIVKFVPFYFLLKNFFLIWLFMPNSKGATIVYYFLVARLFKSVESNIDNAAEHVKEYTKELVNDNVIQFKKIKNTFKATAKLLRKRNERENNMKVNMTMIRDEDDEENEEIKRDRCNKSFYKEEEENRKEGERDDEDDFKFKTESAKKSKKILKIEDDKGDPMTKSKAEAIKTIKKVEVVKSYAKKGEGKITAKIRDREKKKSSQK